MKICTYKKQTPFGPVKRLGIFFNATTVIDANTVWKIYFQENGHYHFEEKAHSKCPSLLSELLRNIENPIERLQETVTLFEDQYKRGILKDKEGSDLAFDLKDYEDVSLGVPLDKITSYRDFYIHEKHVQKGFEKRNEPIPPAWFEIPAYYKGSTTGFIADQDEILWPHYSNKLDYELELGMIVGKSGKNIKATKANEHIFGYTILNDISARDIQKKEMSVRLGPAKGKDFCSIMGPIIITADEFKGKEPDLLMKAFINDELWSEGRSSEGHYTWAQMIEHTSMDEWILPGDFFGSGTVGTGCGLEIDKWIQPGDKIVLDVERIGTLTNWVGYPNKE